MPTYYARATGNVNAAIWATTPSGTASNLFSSFTNADTLMANSFTVTLNVNVTVLEVRNDTLGGATAGGQFNISDNVTLTANVIAGGARCAQYGGSLTATIIGSITGGSGSNASGLFYEGAVGTMNVIGNVTAGTGGSAMGIQVSANSNGIINITGNVTGSPTGFNHGVNVVNPSVINITGTVIGGASSSSGHGVFVNAASGTVNVFGTAIGGAGSAGAVCSNGTLNVTRARGNGFGIGSSGLISAPGVVGTATGLARVSEIEYGDLGQTPTGGNVILNDSTSNVALFYRLSGGKKTLTDPAATVDFPANSNVRSGIVFASGSRTGTCAVPAAGSVALGVPVDNTTGTATLSQANVTTALSAFSDGRLANVATVQSTGQQLADAMSM